MKQYFKLTIITSTTIAILIIGIFLWFDACVYLSIAGHYLYPDSLYAIAYSPNRDCYHAYLIINNEPKDPQLLFTGLSSSIDYNNPVFTTNSTSELLRRTK